MKTGQKLPLAACIVAVLLHFVIPTHAQTFTSIWSFDDASPYGSGVEGGVTVVGNTLYGTTYTGGVMSKGTIYRVNLNGTGYQVLREFAATDGEYPLDAPLISGNTMYGTAQAGGSGFGGVIFSMDLSGSNYTVLKYLSNDQYGTGCFPYGGLVLSSGTLYGACSQGGLASGTIFAINTDGGNYHVIGTPISTNGGAPKAALFLAGSTLYGTMSSGSGVAQYGTVFKVDTGGANYKPVHIFNQSDGANPYSPVIVSGGVVYGTAQAGGLYNHGTIFRVNTDGTGFTNLHDFDYTNGAAPFAGLTLISNTLYGPAAYGGAYSNGALFQINTDGTGFKVIKSFTGTDGSSPLASMTLSSNLLFGTTYSGGTGNGGYGGTIYELSLTGQVPYPLPIATHPVSNGKVQLDYTGSPGTNYVLDAAYSLTSPVNWLPIATNTAASDGSIHFTNTVTATNTYWRVR